MLYFNCQNPMKYILFILFIFIYKGKSVSDNNEIQDKDLDKININKICDSSNLFISNYFQDSINLNLGENILNFSNSESNYSLILNPSEKTYKYLIIYTNLTDKLFIMGKDQEININSTFHILGNDFLNNSEQINFKLVSGKEFEQGFLDLRLENKSEFQINHIIRENFYDRKIKLNKSEDKNIYYINYIPSDNNSDCYYLQFSFSSSASKHDKENIKLFYLNEFKDKRLEKIINELKDKEVKRDRSINGKLEIFGIQYKNLKHDVELELEYNRIKGEGSTGIILTLSVLFFILIIVVGIFFKNVYCGSIKRFSSDGPGEDMDSQ